MVTGQRASQASFSPVVGLCFGSNPQDSKSCLSGKNPNTLEPFLVFICLSELCGLEPVSLASLSLRFLICKMGCKSPSPDAGMDGSRVERFQGPGRPPALRSGTCGQAQPHREGWKGGKLTSLEPSSMTGGWDWRIHSPAFPPRVKTNLRALGVSGRMSPAVSL